MNVSVDNMSSLILTCEERRYIGRTTLDFDTEAILRYFLVGSHTPGPILNMSQRISHYSHGNDQVTTPDCVLSNSSSSCA